jgi:hypothetical protein
MKPHIAFDENQKTTLEWWVNGRKITMYPHDAILLAIVDTIDGSIEEIDLHDHVAVQNAFDWLFENEIK